MLAEQSHREMNCNSGYKKSVKDRRKKTKQKRWINKEGKKTNKTSLHLITHGFGLFLSTLHPPTPPPLQSPARSATDSPEIMLFLSLDTLG